MSSTVGGAGITAGGGATGWSESTAAAKPGRRNIELELIKAEKSVISWKANLYRLRAFIGAVVEPNICRHYNLVVNVSADQHPFGIGETIDKETTVIVEYNNMFPVFSQADIRQQRRIDKVQNSNS